MTYHYNGIGLAEGRDRCRRVSLRHQRYRPTHAWAVGSRRNDPALGRQRVDGLREGAHNESQALWVAGPNDAWAGGFGGLAHYDGTRWTLLPGVQGIHGVWGSAPDDVGRSGQRSITGTARLCRATRCALLTPARRVGTARDDVWAVGQGSQIYHYDGAKWDRVTSPVSTWLLAVWAAARNDVWVAGDYGVVLHGDGTRFTRAPSTGSATSGRAFLGLRRDRAYLATSSGLFKYSGAGWDLVSACR